MSEARFRSPTFVAGAILRTTAAAVGSPLLTRSRGNAASALRVVQHRRRAAAHHVGVGRDGPPHTAEGSR